MKKRILAMLIAFSMACSLLPTSLVSFATDEPDTWENYAATSFVGGSGTEGDPYQIASAEQLALLATDLAQTISWNIQYDNAYFVLTADIDLDGHEWVPMGTVANNYFSGSLDGQGYSIKNMTITQNYTKAGLFANLAGTVSNLVFEGVSINQNDTSGTHVGTVAGYVSWGEVYNITVASGSIQGSGYVGGVVGYIDANGGTMFNCVNKANINYTGLSSSSKSYVGGIVGRTETCSLNYCTNYGNITGQDAVALGGISGSNYEPSNIYNCINYGDITATNEDRNSTPYIGGIIGVYGQNITTAAIANCINKGDITDNYTNNYSSGDYSGGIAGYVTAKDGAEYTLYNCLNTGAIAQADWQSNTTYDTTLLVGLSNYTYIVSHCYALGETGDTFTAVDNERGTYESCEIITDATNVVSLLNTNVANSTIAGLGKWAGTTASTAALATAGLSGTVVDDKGNAVANATVTLRSTPTIVLGTTTTDATGKYDFGTMTQGIYEVTISGDGVMEYTRGFTIDGEIVNDVTMLSFEDYTTSGSTIEIANANQFAKLAEELRDGLQAGDVALTGTIDLSGYYFSPIDEYCDSDGSDTPYQINLDGKGNTISGLTVDTAIYYGGLFQSISRNDDETSSSFANIVFDGASISSAEKAAVLIGYHAFVETQIDNIQVKNSTVSAPVAGGIIADGYYIPSTISNCTTDSNTSITGTNVAGGILGSTYAERCIIENCTNNATVTATSGSAAGIAYEVDSVTNCINNGDISGQTAVGIVYGTEWDGSVEYCINNGDISGQSAAGIAGSGYCTVISCENYGTITNRTSDTTTVCLAGIGMWGATIKNCANYGDVIVTGTLSNQAGSYVAGIGAQSDEVYNSYNAGIINLNGNNDIPHGGIYSGDCYWDNDVRNNYNAGTITGATTTYGVSSTDATWIQNNYTFAGAATDVTATANDTSNTTFTDAQTLCDALNAFVVGDGASLGLSVWQVTDAGDYAYPVYAPPVDVTFHVENSKGAAVSGATVTIADLNDKTVAEGTTDGDGGYTAQELSTGTYLITVTADDHLTTSFLQSVADDSPVAIKIIDFEDYDCESKAAINPVDAAKGYTVTTALIENVNQLAKFFDSPYCNQMMLTAEIDLSGYYWVPQTLTKFDIDGQGHTISGLTIKLNTAAAFFDVLNAYNSSDMYYLQNLNFTNVDIQGGSDAGSAVLAVEMYNTNLSNVSASGTVVGNAIYGNDVVAGLVAELYVYAYSEGGSRAYTFEDITMDVDVTNTADNHAAGVFGSVDINQYGYSTYNYDVTFENIVVKGDVTAKLGTAYGVTRDVYAPSNSATTQSIQFKNVVVQGDLLGEYATGVVSSSYPGTTILNTSVQGNLTALDGVVCGLTSAYENVSVYNCMVTADLSGHTIYALGTGKDILNSYYAGSVTIANSNYLYLEDATESSGNYYLDGIAFADAADHTSFTAATANINLLTALNTWVNENKATYAGVANWAAGNPYPVYALPATVTYNANGGTGDVPVVTEELYTGGTYTILGNTTALTYPDASFAGWSLSADGTDILKADDVITLETVNTSLYAVWAKGLDHATVEVDGTYTYTGEAQEYSFTVKESNDTLVEDTDYTVVSIQVKDGDAVESIVNAGDYTITIEGMGKYTGTVTIDLLTVEQKELAIDVGGFVFTKVYDSTTALPDHADTIGTDATGITVEVTAIAALNHLQDDVGDYTLEMTLGEILGDGKENYKLTSATVDVTATITPFVIAQVSYENLSFTKEYDGTTDFKTGGGAITLMNADGDPVPDSVVLNYTADGYVSADVGEAVDFKITPSTLADGTFSEADNYTLAVGISGVQVSIAKGTITKATPDITLPTAPELKVGRTVNDLAALVVATVGGVNNTEVPTGTLAFFSDSTYETALSNTDLTALEVDNVITIYYTFTLNDVQSNAVNKNYTDENSKGSFVLTIVDGDPQIVTFADATQSKTYGESFFTAMASVADEGGNAINGASVSYESSDTDVATVTADGTVTIVGAGAATITATAAAVTGEYAVGSGSYTLTVSPKAITVTADNASRVYGESDPDFTVSVGTDVLVGTDAVSDLGIDLTTDAEKTSVVGNVYTISGTDNDETDNYIVTVTSGTLTITEKQLTWNADGVIAKTYDGTTNVAASDITTAPTLNGVLSGDDVSVSVGNVTFDSAAVGSSSVSATGYTIDGTAASNYIAPIAQPTFSASIAAADYSVSVPATLEVKVGSGATAMSAATATVTGVNGETPKGALTFTVGGVTLTDTDINALAIDATLTVDWAFALSGDSVNGNYVTTGKTGSITLTIVEGDPQYLTFTEASKAVTYGDDGFTNAIASVTTTEGATVSDGGAITYASDNTAVAMVDASSGAVTIIGAGTANITATAAAVPGSWAKGNASYALTVAPKTPTVTDFSITVPSDTQYDGNAVAASVSVASGIVGMGELTVRYNDEAVAPTNVDDYTVTFDVAAGSNYAAITGLPAGSFSITKAAAPTLSAMTQNVYYATAQTDVAIDLTKVEGLPADAGNVTYTISATSDSNDILSTSAIADGVLTFSTNAMSDKEQSATITVGVEMGNYTSTTFDVVITTVDKLQTTISGIAVADKVYDGNSATYTGIAVGDQDYTGGFTYTWREGNTVLDAAPVDVGSYTLTVAIPDSDATHMGNVTLAMEITPKAVTLKPANISMYNTAALPTEFTLIAVGLVDGDTIAAEGDAPSFVLMNGEEVLTTVANGSYTILWENKDAVIFANDNYTFTKTDGTLTISSKPSSSSGSSDSDYTVTTDPTPTPTPTATSTTSQAADEDMEEDAVVVETTTAPTATPAPTTPEESAPSQTTQDSGTVSVSLAPTVEGTTATAAVPEEAMQSAVEQALAVAAEAGTAPVVALDVAMPEGAESVSVSLAAETLAALAAHPEAALTLTTNVGTITLDSATISGLVAAADGAELRLEIAPVATATLNETQQAVVGDAPVYDLSVYLGDAYVANFEGEVAVSLPYTLKDGETADGILVYYLDDMGNIEQMETVYDSLTQSAQFTTTHFSVYVVSHTAVASSSLPILPIAGGSVLVLALLGVGIFFLRKRSQEEED